MLETFNDEMLKSAVQELTTKVVKLAKKITGLESTALPSPENADIGKSVIVGPNKSYALVGPFGAVPEPKTADRGKTVKVKSNKNEYELVAVPSVPTPTVADENKVLSVDNTGAYALVSTPNIPTPAIADEGKVLGVNSSGAYALVSGGDNEAILTVNAQKMGLICTNPLADMWHIYQNFQAPTGEIKGLNTLIKGETIIFYNQDTSILELGNLLYYLDEQGNEIPYSGTKNFAQIDTLSMINGTMIQNAFGNIVVQSATDSGLIVDLDTGHIIYAGGIQ